MSVRIVPCYRCPIRDGCQQRDEFRRKARGIGAASIRFECQRLADAIKPGTRIEIDQPYLDEDGNGFVSQVCYERMPATITHSDGRRFACTVDEHEWIENPKYRFRRMAPAHRVIRFLDEPERKLCPLCGSVILLGGRCDTPDGPVDHVGEIAQYKSLARSGVEV